MSVLLESRSFRPFKSSEEYLYAMKEDLAEWLNNLYPDLYINVDNFMDRLDTGVALCKHANSVRKYAEEYVTRRQSQGKIGKSSAAIAASVLQLNSVRFFPGAKPGTFFARDNVSNFISWCRRGLGVFECLLFETDDLIMRKNEKHVILCLLEVARRGAKLGMPAPMLVQLEREIDREIAADKREFQRGLSATQGYDFDDDDDESDLSDMEDCRQYGPLPQIVTNDLKSLDEMVRDLVERCRCPTQFPMIRVSEGKYRIGDTKVLIFVRFSAIRKIPDDTVLPAETSKTKRCPENVLRSHVMVRVGGGWDTLSHYLDKHDPCRCKTAHRAPISAKVVNMKLGIPAADIAGALVHYDRSPPRTRRSSASSVGSNGGGINSLAPTTPSASVRNRSHSPAARDNANLSVANRSSVDRDTAMRSRSPTPRRTLTPAARSSVERETSHSPADSRKLSPARQDRGRNRSRSPTPRRLTPNRTENNRSRSPTPRRQTRTSRPSTPSINHHRSRSSSPKEISLETTESVDTVQNKLNADNSDSLVKANICQHSRSLTPLADFSSVNVIEGNLVNEAVSILQADIVSDADRVRHDSISDTTDCLKITDNVINELTKTLKEDATVDNTPYRKISENFVRGVNDDDSGVDTSPCHKISDNFINHPTRSHSIDQQRKISPAVQEYESGVDTSPSHRVSDNFTNQHRVSVTVRQGPSSSAEVTSGVDTMPFRKVSDNFEPSDFGGAHHHTTRRYLPGNKFGSASALDSLGNDNQVNNDSGSEVSDEGYRSLGIVTTPPATANQKAGPSPKGSPVRAARTARSRSVGGGGHEAVSPQQSPFRRNTPVNRSARISSSAATPAARGPTPTSYNTWNSSGGRSGKKQRPSISADTFCQQVADIMQQYAAMMPSPRKDSKPDSGVTTRIPAPVQRT